MSDFQADYFEDSQSMTDWEASEEATLSMTDWEASEEGAFDEVAMDYSSEALAQAEQILGFIERTPELTESEQAELLGAFVEDARRTGEVRSGEVDWSRIARGVQTGLNLFRTGAQVAGGIAGAVGGNSRTARNISLWTRRLGQGAGFAQNLLGNIRPGQTPRLSPGVQRPAPTARPSPGRVTPPAARTATPARSPLNNTAQFASLLNNPQIMRALRSALFRGREGVLRVESATWRGAPDLIPLGDAMETLARLAQESALELRALTVEDAAEVPSYLIGEDGEYIIDPQNAEDREALVLELMRRQSQVERYQDLDEYVAPDGYAGEDMSVADMDEVDMDETDVDESDVWAREAGFDD